MCPEDQELQFTRVTTLFPSWLKKVTAGVELLLVLQQSKK